MLQQAAAEREGRRHERQAENPSREETRLYNWMDE
jgi:hypothetical protein